jgi:hypothetical protein
MLEIIDLLPPRRPARPQLSKPLIIDMTRDEHLNSAEPLPKDLEAYLVIMPRGPRRFHMYDVHLRPGLATVITPDVRAWKDQAARLRQKTAPAPVQQIRAVR